MIRPVPYVDLPGMIYALDRWMRARNGEYANFVIAPDAEEPRSGLAALLSALWPITPHVHTWICEDRWHPLGVAQGRMRAGAQAWDLAYLATMTPSNGAIPPPTAPDEVLFELVQYALDAALMHGVQRVFARVEDERPEIEIFGKLGFQRYAREVTYWLPSIQNTLLSGNFDPGDRLRDLATEDCGDMTDDPGEISASDSPIGPDEEQAPALSSRYIPPSPQSFRTIPSEVPLRRWHRHDAWGLLRLYDACTPRRVQVAESLTSDEFVHTRAAGGRTWYLPLVEPTALAVVLDRGVRLGGWLRLRFGRGSQPHRLWLMAHPDEPDVPLALLRFGLRALAERSPRPVICQAREYEGAVINALRAVGFEHAATHALLVRHLTMRALQRREVPALEPRVVYGVKGLGTAPTRFSEGEKTHYATRDH